MEIKEELLDISNIKSSKKTLIDLFIRRTAVLTSTSEDLVEKIIKDQWSYANKQTQTDNPIKEISIPNIGTFKLSDNKARRRVRRLADLEAKALDAISKDESVRRIKEIKIGSYKKISNSIKIKNKMITDEDKH